MTDQQMVDRILDSARQYEKNYPKVAAELRIAAERLRELAGLNV